MSGPVLATAALAALRKAGTAIAAKAGPVIAAQVPRIATTVVETAATHLALKSVETAATALARLKSKGMPDLHGGANRRPAPPTAAKAGDPGPVDVISASATPQGTKTSAKK